MAFKGAFWLNRFYDAALIRIPCRESRRLYGSLLQRQGCACPLLSSWLSLFPQPTAWRSSHLRSVLTSSQGRYLHRHMLYRKQKENLNPFSAHLVEIPTALWTEPRSPSRPSAALPACNSSPTRRSLRSSGPQCPRPPNGGALGPGNGVGRALQPERFASFFISLNGEGYYRSQSTLLGYVSTTLVFRNWYKLALKQIFKVRLFQHSRQNFSVALPIIAFVQTFIWTHCRDIFLINVYIIFISIKTQMSGLKEWK